MRAVNLYVAVVVVVTATLVARADIAALEPTFLFWNTFGTLLALGLFAEAFSLRLHLGTTTSAVSFVPYLAALILLGPSWAMLVAGSSELVAETLIRRKPLVKIIHNTCKEMTAIWVAGTLYLLLGGTPSHEVFSVSVFAFLAATAVYFIITNGATAIAVTLSTKTDLTDAWNIIVGRGIVQHDLMASALSVLLAFLHTELGVLGVTLMIVPLFFVRHAHRVNLQMEQTNRDLLDLMVKSIEARDPYTSGHSVRVARSAKLLARSLGLQVKEIEQIETAALLHDVGKIYEEFAPILRKEGGLTQEEVELMHTHPIRSAELVGTISDLRGYVQDCVRHHHERFDGAGYPDGVAGDAIPFGARIIMIADTADAMTTDRPYRKALTYERVVLELDRLAGVQFDPDLVSAFKRSAPLRRLVSDRGRTEAQSDGAEDDGPLLTIAQT